MADSSTATVTTVTLTLSKEEALYIKGITQNSMQEMERIEESKLRESIFNALSDFKPLLPDDFDDDIPF